MDSTGLSVILPDDGTLAVRPISSGGSILPLVPHLPPAMAADPERQPNSVP
jgi:hypothetical protein